MEQGVPILHIGNNPRVYDRINVRDEIPLANISLHFAVEYQDLDLVNDLLEGDVLVPINATDSYGQTALQLAICKGEFSPPPDIPIIKRLLQHKHIDVNTMDWKFASPLLLAVQNNSLEIVELLLSKGANPNLGRDSSGGSCLHVALSLPTPDYNIVRQLLINGADINHFNAAGRTPLDILLKNSLNLQKARNSLNLQKARFAKKCLKLVILICEIRIDLMIKRSVDYSQLFPFVNKCYKEVEKMKVDKITGHLTVYHFATAHFDVEHCLDPNLQIYKPVVERLVRGFYIEYFYHVFNVLPEKNLCAIAETIICPELTIKDAMKENSPKLVAKMDFGICKFLSRLDIFSLIVAFSNGRISEAFLELMADFSEHC